MRSSCVRAVWRIRWLVWESSYDGISSSRVLTSGISWASSWRKGGREGGRGRERGREREGEREGGMGLGRERESLEGAEEKWRK